MNWEVDDQSLQWGCRHSPARGLAGYRPCYDDGVPVIENDTSLLEHQSHFHWMSGREIHVRVHAPSYYHSSYTIHAYLICCGISQTRSFVLRTTLTRGGTGGRQLESRCLGILLVVLDWSGGGKHQCLYTNREDSLCIAHVSGVHTGF